MSLRIAMPFSIIVLVLIASVSCDGGSSSITENASTEFPREASLEEASEVLGVEVPSPTYLPIGYEIRRIIIEDDSLVLFVISDESDHYIELKMHWNIIPLKLFPNATRVEINGDTGCLLEGDDSNDICWNYWKADVDKYKEGLFVVKLTACKEIPIEELLLIARSID